MTHVYKGYVVASDVFDIVEAFLSQWFDLRKKGETINEYISYCMSKNQEDYLYGGDQAAVSMAFSMNTPGNVLGWTGQFSERDCEISWQKDDEGCSLSIEIEIADDRSPWDTRFFSRLTDACPWLKTWEDTMHPNAKEVSLDRSNLRHGEVLPHYAEELYLHRAGQSWAGAREMEEAKPGDHPDGLVEIVELVDESPYPRIWYDKKAVWLNCYTPRLSDGTPVPRMK